MPRSMSQQTIQSRPVRKTPPRNNKSVFYSFLKVHDWSSDYVSVDNMLRHLARKTMSEATRKSYCWQLYGFSQFTRKKPNELIRLRRDVAERLVQKYADKLKEASPRYANLAIASLRAFFSTNGFKHARTLELESYHVPRRFRATPEYIPTKIEVYRMADSAGSLRDRAIILSLFSSGLRNSTLRALLYRDVVEDLRNGVANVRLPVYPEMKLIDPCACKGGIPYSTFICDEGTSALRLYIKERVEKNGELAAFDPLFASEYNQVSKEERMHRILTSREVQLIVKETAKKADIPEWDAVHPHALRKSFETVLHSQLVDGSNMDVKVQEVLMGHILPGSQDNYFDLSKVEWMRVQYSRLKFGRPVIEDKFKVLQTAVARAFEGTGIDPEQVIQEYAKNRQSVGTKRFT